MSLIMSSNPYHLYARSFRNLSIEGKGLPFGTIPKNENLKISKSTGEVALILAPHPDDECIMGALPLRLLREAGFRIVTFAITLGSKIERKEERFSELEKACKWIGFELELLGQLGFDQVTPSSRKNNQAYWLSMVDTLKEAVAKWNPSALFFPNSKDWNQTHLGVHLLTMDALSKMPGFSPFLFETEYWGQMPQPNILVESTTEHVGDLLTALSHHRGELERNPFHLTMPAWMQDNVRRGTEVIGGQGGQAPDFEFASLYRISRWISGKMVAPWSGGRFLPAGRIATEELFDKTN